MSKIIKYYRHAETKWNKEGRLQGWLDSELTEQGIQQAKQVQWEPEIVFCSDLNRAFQTARYMFPNSAIHTSEHLREINLGHWQGCLISNLQNDGQYNCYTNSPQLFQQTTQESFQQVTSRMLAFHESLDYLPYRKIAVVSHGVALACFFIALKNQGYENLWKYLLTGATCETVTF
ncbi:histidine phosphatase family protein [Solibacillus cecembensis]|uniref:histidine phosphatase family protein n=1 Tax=Solibacillus cecembensis TaxID=459347 RepID=UPI0007173E17